jgi:hypothetical protein
MQQIFIRFGKVLAVGLMSLALAACSGGGDGGSNFNAPAGITTTTISGTVSGTTFVAVDATTNAELGRVAASSGAAGGEKSFSLSLPPGRTYKFYLIENDGTADARLFPLYQGAANRFTISAVTTIGLGFIGTSTGIALPANDMTRIGGVAGAGEDKTIPASLAAAAFSTADLQGNWNVLQMVGGATPRWVRGAVAIDAAGSAPASDNQSSDGSGTSPAITYSIATSGVVTFSAGTIGGFQGIMTKDKGMIVGTYTPDAGDYALVTMVRSGGTYAQSDLQGTWAYNRLLAGTAQGWSRGDVSIAADGAVNFSNVVTNSGAGDAAAATLNIDAAGIVTDPANANTHGVMSPDRKLLSIVTTGPDGAVSLTVMTRTGGTIFTGSDFQGTWRMNWLTAGSSSYWGRALFITDGTGTSSMQSTLLSFGSSADSTLATKFFSDGTVDITNTDFSGILSLGKNVMVGTKTDGTGFSLYVHVR